MGTFYATSVRSTSTFNVRVSFNRPPLACSPELPGDGLDPARYSVTGPGVRKVTQVSYVPGDVRSLDLLLDLALQPGSWTLVILGVTLPDGTALDQSSFDLASFSGSSRESTAQGAEDVSYETQLTEFMNPAFREGKAWQALLTALASSDIMVHENARKAFNQLYVSSATGQYLTERAADQGLEKPPLLGISDELFQKLCVQVSTRKLTQNSFLELLEIFYGPDTVRAFAVTDSSEPFQLTDGSTQDILVDEKALVSFKVTAAEYSDVTSASSVELAAALNRAFRNVENEAYAVPYLDPVTGLTYTKVYSGTLGLSSSLRFLGGQAQNDLLFPSRIENYAGPNPLPTWTVTLDAATGKMSFTTTGAVGTDMSMVVVGDVVNLYGAEFNVANRGTFSITKVKVSYPLGVKTQIFEVSNRTALPQMVVQLVEKSVYFFRPTRQDVHKDEHRSVAVVQSGGLVTVRIPATSQVVNRSPKEAAYLQEPRTFTITSAETILGVTTFTSAGHGLSAGDHVIVDDVFSDLAKPSVTPGNTGVSPQLAAYSQASQASPLKATTGSPTKDHTATTLKDGRVLLAGGVDTAGPTYRTTCELFRQTASTVLAGGVRYSYEWEAAGSLGTATAKHAACLSTDLATLDKVLLSGGTTGAAALATSYLYTPAPPSGAGTWAASGTMNAVRLNHGMVQLQDKRMMVVGGENFAGTELSSCERWTPSTGVWALTAAMSKGRSGAAVVVLSDGRVLVIGGRVSGVASTSCELYDPAGNSWSITGQMSMARTGHKTFLMDDGRVMVLGGTAFNPSQGGSPASTKITEIWEPATGTWSSGPPLSTARNVADVAKLNGTWYVASGNTVDVEAYVGGRWVPSCMKLSASRDAARLNAGSGWMLLSGGTFGGASCDVNHLLVPAHEDLVSGKLDDILEVASVPTGSTFTVASGSVSYLSAHGGTATVVKALPSDNYPGPFTYDLTKGPVVTGTESTSTVALAAGHQYLSVDVLDSTVFPDEDGWLCFAFATERETFPVRYLGRLSATSLSLDYTFVFPVDLPSGSSVTLLFKKGTWVPDFPEQVGSFYLTASFAGKEAAELKILETSAGGRNLELDVVYPSDRGLGNAGYPTHGTAKLTDAIRVWGGDDLDAEVATAKDI